MSTIRQVITVAIPALLVAAWLEWDERRQKAKQRSLGNQDQGDVRVTRESASGGGEMLRFRGGFDDVMNLLHNRPADVPPALPADLNTDELPKYYGGCPHCKAMSFVGEGLWRYRVLECTRERWDNTTTYLARCKKCQGLMRATVDHND